MRRIQITFLFLCLLNLHALASNKRIDTLFNFGWKYIYGDIKDGQKINYPDNEWRTIDLPHDFQFEQPWDKKNIGGRGFKPLGIGWYRKTFTPEASWRGRRIILDFEGIALNGEIWLNGKKIGDNYYGYLGCQFDITQQLLWNKPNTIAVRASTGTRSSSRWYTGGGIYRDVHLVVKDSAAIARHGVYVTTPKVTANSAEVQVQVELDCPRTWRKDVTIHAKILDPNGNIVGETMAKAPTLSKLKLLEVPLPGIHVTNPKLWSCDTPNLYTVRVTIMRNGNVTDETTETFGIRTMEFSKGIGFMLNGKKLFLKGIACHHDLGMVGAAAFETSIRRQFKMLKQFGYNCIRTAHNPYSEAFLREADRQGFIIIDEFTDKWADNSYWAGSIPFCKYWPMGIPEWIKRDRNHPSVAMWSLGNELQFREDLCGYPTSDWGVTTYRILDIMAKRYDSTHPTTVAMFPSRANGIDKHDSIYNTYLVAPELAKITDVASFNYCYDAYADYLKDAPNLNIFQSEASTHELAAAFFGMDRKRMVGLAYWGAIEYWGESSGWPKKGWNYSFFNHTLEPYPQAWLIKSAFQPDSALVRIAVVDEQGEELEWNDVVSGRMTMTSHWNRPKGSVVNLFTFTNDDEVELRLNGKSLGRQRNDTTDIRKRNMIYWKDIPYETGTLTAVAYKNGKVVARHTLQTTEKAVALKAVVENRDWKGDGMDLQYIRVYAVDKKGRHVPYITDQVKFSVEGAAKLKAIDNGDHYTNELFDVNPKHMLDGFVMGILRANRTPGKVKVRITSDNMKSVTLNLETR